MSDENTPPTPKTSSIPPPGQAKTAAVPLKKETVRITLRARPGAGVTQPREATAPITPSGEPRKTTAQVSLPAAPLPPASVKAPTSPVSLPPAPIPPPGRKTMNVTPAPTAPAPSAPAPTVPMPSGAPRPPAPSAPGAPRPPTPAAGLPRPAAPPAPGAPRPPAPGGAPAAPAAPAPRMETGATTQPLSAAPRPPMVGAPRPPAAGGATAPMAAGSGTTSLPKATQKLSAAPAPMSRPAIAAPPSAPVKRAAMADSQQFYEEKDPEAGLMPLSIVCFLLAAVLMAVQMLATDKVTSVPSGEEHALMVPAASPPAWESRDEESGVYTSKWSSALPPLPE